MTATFNILQSHFELRLQNIESCSQVTADFKICTHVIADFKRCSQISNYDCNLLKVVVIIRNCMIATFNILELHYNYDCKMLKVAVT